MEEIQRLICETIEFENQHKQDMQIQYVEFDDSVSRCKNQ